MRKAGYMELDEKLARETREKLRKNENSLYEALNAREPASRRGLTDPMPGDRVYLRKLKREAYALTAANAQGDITVQAGIMKLTTHKDEIELIAEDDKAYGAADASAPVAGSGTGAALRRSRIYEPRHKTGEGAIGAGKAKTIRPELDLRGKMVDEAVTEVEKYLDDAYLAGLPQISVIHGKGTGALRKAVRDLAANHPFVALARRGADNEGGDGVTVMTISL
jgi:DNA mismatch repair protein MutS2